jgi:hypothetical protein
MTARFNPTLLAGDELVAAPVLRACADQTFELPAGLYIATAAMFLGFVSVLGFAFRNPALAVPFGIFVTFIGAFFAVPSLFARVAPSTVHALRWSQFAEQGVVTANGRCSAREATILVLLLPFLILCWAIAIATIAALV